MKGTEPIDSDSPLEISSCATPAYAAFDFKTAVERVHACGFDGVEITELGAYCRHLPYLRSSPDEVARLLAETEMSVTEMYVSTADMRDGMLTRYSMGDPLHRDRIIAYS